MASAPSTHTNLGSHSFTSWNVSASESTTIPDGTLFTRLITESGSGTIEHIRVAIAFSHLLPNSLGFRLESPSGTVTTILPPVTALTTNPTTAVFVQLPVNALYGEDKAGTWKLHIVDHLVGGTGTFAQWAITFMYR